MIHLMSPCNVAGDIMSVRSILISRRPKSSFLWHSGPDSGVFTSGFACLFQAAWTKARACDNPVELEELKTVR